MAAVRREVDNITSSLLKAMHTYSSKLEETVAERTRELAEEKQRTDALLYQMLPPAVANELKGGKAAPAQAFDSVTIYFSDIVGFTNIASQCKPIQIVALLNALYTLFDITISEYNVYKVETIGDSYMVASGLPVPNPDHACAVADMALALNRKIKGFVLPHDRDTVIRIRIGLNTGPVVAGVVGMTMPRYCLFGDTVNVASRMESTGVPEMIHVSHTTKEAIGDNPNYILQPRGQIEIKGKGKMQTYFLFGEEKPGADKLSGSSSCASDRTWPGVRSEITSCLTSVESIVT
ncbi:atrial natriuretic peptide receptor 1-like [Littorina saxatilis]|uniref:atrial natriuretic peptide receptor 1-like n=1 Tax=Littorina saxatilis TaxID=31220 RepID=UPI0038B624ED